MKKKLRRFCRQVTADKKKFALLVTVLAVGLLLWGRLILLEDVPKIATADPKPGQAAQAAAPGGPEAGRPDAPPAATLPPLPEVRVNLSGRLAGNLFALRHNHYRPLPVEDSGGVRVETGQPAVDEQERRRELLELARALRLQSVIHGNAPAIVINGAVLRVGDSIEGFEVASFNNRSAKVTRGGLTFTLNMME